jgi:hypothetical protein
VKTLKVTDEVVVAAAPTRGKLLPHPHPPLSYLQVNKQDSGFTEKSKLNASSSSSDDDASDELYSLLSLIQYKVESLGRRSTSSSQLKSSTAGGTESVIELGTLDDQLGNSSFDFSKFKKINKHVIRAVLQCHDKVELKRQLLFTYARVKVRAAVFFERRFLNKFPGQLVKFFVSLENRVSLETRDIFCVLGKSSLFVSLATDNIFRFPGN